MIDTRLRAPCTPRGDGAGRPGVLARLLCLTTLAACSGAGGERRDAAGESAAAAGAGQGACAPAGARIDGTGVGPVRLGAGPSSFAACARRDTTWSQEGMAEHGWVVRVGEGSILAVVTGDTVVRRIDVTDPAPRTAAGAGVGSTAAELRRAYGAPCAFPGGTGGVVAVFPALPGVSFATDAPLPRGVIRASVPLPDSARVTTVLVHGATVRCTPGER